MELPVISCDGCGACCMWVGEPPFSQNEPRPMVDMVPNKINTPCCWLDMETKKCKNYEHRPRICRDFERGGQDCLELRLQQGVK